MRKFIFFSWIFILIGCIICMPISLATSESVYVWSNFSNTISNESNTNSIKESTNSVSTTPIDLNLESASAILIEQNTGKILYEHNAHEQLRPASVTKVMSILLIMEALDTGKIALTDKVPCSQTAASMGGSQIWLDVREELTVDEMLKAICVASANDCVVAMAEYLEGSQEAFVAKMNAKATQLGMLDTCFKNCHGLDEDGHVTSAYDISLMSQELLKKHPSITNYTTIWIDSLRDGKSELTNTNKLIRNYKGATGLKTGSTGLALYNLSASATRDSLSLIAVIMKAPSTKVRFAEAEKLLDYGFNNYSYQSFAKSGDVLKTIHINKGVKSSVEAVYETDAGSLLQKGQGKEIEQVVTIADTIEAPITKGQKIGEITYTLNGEVIETTNLISNAEIKKISLTNMMENLFFTWFRILR
ncbi:MAG: D-alanyl-D-alanine carboxypeptidase family protein [Clostridia bacterium]